MRKMSTNSVEQEKVDKIDSKWHQGKELAWKLTIYIHCIKEKSHLFQTKLFDNFFPPL